MAVSLTLFVCIGLGLVEMSELTIETLGSVTIALISRMRELSRTIPNSLLNWRFLK